MLTEIPMVHGKNEGFWICCLHGAGSHLCALLVALFFAVTAFEAVATPYRVIVLRHGEKADSYQLSPVGRLRAQALAHQFLGRGATQSLFPPGEQPAAFLSTTLHTIELITPAAETWGKPTVAYSWAPGSGTKEEETVALNRRTREAARDLFQNPEWHGRTVVICWEHHHIADEALERQFPGESVTWRQLLRLDRLPSFYRWQAPLSWEGANFDYFWIVTFRGDRPVRFESKLQAFEPPFDSVPQNLWGEPEYPLNEEDVEKPQE